MGIAATQARILLLTGTKSNAQYTWQQICNTKIQLANKKMNLQNNIFELQKYYFSVASTDGVTTTTSNTEEENESILNYREDEYALQEADYNNQVEQIVNTETILDQQANNLDTQIKAASTELEGLNDILKKELESYKTFNQG